MLESVSAQQGSNRIDYAVVELKVFGQRVERRGEKPVIRATETFVSRVRHVRRIGTAVLLTRPRASERLLGGTRVCAGRNPVQHRPLVLPL